VSNVIEMLAWPSSSWTTLGCSPAASISDATVWHRSWTDFQKWDDGPLAGKTGKGVVIPDRDKRRTGKDGGPVKVEWPPGLTTFLGCVRWVKDAKRHVVVEGPRQALALPATRPTTPACGS
jgi:hypothetical protein